MEININCDLGEKSKHHSNKYDPDLLEIVNSANIAVDFMLVTIHESMNQVVQISKRKMVLVLELTPHLMILKTLEDKE